MMRTWQIRQDCPIGGVLHFAGQHAFQARWSLDADPPSENLLEQDLTTENQGRYWFRTGEDDDDIIIHFDEFRWQSTPPGPQRLRKLMKKAVNEINQMIGERF